MQHLRIVDFPPVLTRQADAADAVIAISDFVRAEALKCEIAPQKIRVIYNEVDVDYFHPRVFDRTKVRSKHKLPATAKIVLMVARFAPNKRHDVLLRAASLMRPSLDSFHLVLVGEVYGARENYDRMRSEVESLGLTSHVTFYGFAEDIRELYAAADVLVLCSDREPLGRCVVEAMSMGVPVVVTDSGGTHEIVKDGEVGFVVPGGGAHVLAARLEQLLSDTSLCETMGNAGRNFVLSSNLNAKNSAQMVMDIYDELIRRARVVE